jgi:acetyltransferase-like isoleucine patch superfamily enzyme
MGRLRWILLQAKGWLVFGRRAVIFGNFTVSNPKRVTIGANCHINHDVFLLGRTGISIGNDVVLSARCMLLDAGLDSHSLSGFEQRRHIDGPIRVGDGAWIGAGAIILPGVTIGDQSIVGAGSVVTKDVPARTVVAGNPARVLRAVDLQDALASNAG